MLWLAMAGWAAALSALSITRHHAYNTGRYDLGNMVQAVWSTLQGRPLETTFAGGMQGSRLGAHVDPILAAFAPLWAVWPAPEMLIVAQAVLVALGALPAFWLGRRWLGDDRLALAAAGAYLLYPPLQLATVFDFHPVTLAAPLLLFCIWAAVEGRLALLGVLAVAAVLTKEEVGLALLGLGIWMVVEARHAPPEGRRRRRVAGGALAVAGPAWVAVAVLVIIPRYSPAGESLFLDRYGRFGDSPGEILLTLLTRPWEALALLGDPARIGYLAALLLPLALLPLAAPLLALGALPELVINLISDRPAQYSIAFQYVAVIAPFLIAAAIRGLARVRERGWLRLPDRRVAAGVVGVSLAATLLLGPIPRPSGLAIAWSQNVDQYRTDPERERALDAALALIPDDVPVSAGNLPAAHLSAREHIYTFPVVADARWVVVDRSRPHIADRREPVRHRLEVARLLAGGAFEVVFDRSDVLVLRRRGA